MKKRIVALCLILLFPLLACDALEELVEQEFDENISFVLSFGVDSEATGNPDEEVSLNTTSNSYFIAEDPNIRGIINDPNEIKKIKINSIRYEYKNFSGNVDAKVVSAFSIGIGFGQDEIFTTPSTNVAQAALLGELFTLEGNLDKVSDFATESGGVQMLHGGSATHNPVNFVTEVTINVTVTIQVDVSNL